MRDSLPSARYSPVCNVLRQWKTSLIPTYRVYRLYDTNIATKVINSPNSCNTILYIDLSLSIIIMYTCYYYTIIISISQMSL